MRGADPGEVRVERVAAGVYVAHFGVGNAVDRLAIHHQPAADAGADGEVGDPARTPARRRVFCQCGGVHIGVEAYRHAQRLAKPARNIAIGPAGLGGVGDEAPLGRAAVKLDRSEAADAERAHPAPPRQPFRRLGQGFGGRAGGDRVAGDDAVRRPADCEDELGAPCLDPGQHQAALCTAGARKAVRSPSSSSLSSGAGTPPKLPSGRTSMKLHTVRSASTYQL